MVMIRLKKVYFETINKLDLFFYQRYARLPNIIKRIFCWFVCTFHILLMKTDQEKIICMLPDKSQKLSDRKINRMVKKVYKKFKKGTFLFAFSSNIKEQQQFKQALERYQVTNIIWAEGKWLLSHLILMMLEYISKLQQIEVKEQKVEILMKEVSDLSYYEIKELAEKVKRLKIITPDITKFRRIERELYEEDGIAIELSNNKKKSLSKSTLIINVDFPKELIDQYKINRKAILIHIQEKVKMESLQFSGINVYDCNINFAPKIQDEFKQQPVYNQFYPNILYETYLYRKDNPENIIKQIQADQVFIEYLIGNKGKINELEFKNLFQFT